jgi:hypothetical protein
MGANFGTAVEKTVAAAIVRLPKKDKRRKPLFLYMVRDHLWSWDKHAECYLPELGKFTRSAGINGVGLTANHLTDDKMGRANYQAKGWRIIENGDSRFADVITDGNYVTRWHAGSGYAYGPIWAGFELIGREVVWEINQEVRVAFLQRVMSAGLVAPMHPKLREANIREQKRKLTKLENAHFQKSNDTHIKAKIGEVQKFIKVLEKDLADALKVALADKE